MKHVSWLMVLLVVCAALCGGCDAVKDLFEPIYCSSDAECPSDMYCDLGDQNQRGTCRVRTACLCSSDADCPTGQHCVFSDPDDTCGYACAPDDIDGDADPDVIDTVDGDTTDIDGDMEDAVDTTEVDGDMDEITEQELEAVERPDPGISGYVIAILHSVNTPDYDGNEMSLYQLGDNGSWGAFYQRETFTDSVVDVTFTPDCTRMLVAEDSGNVDVYTIEDGLIAFMGSVDTEAYVSSMRAVRNDAVYILDGNGEQWGGGLKLLDLRTNPGVMTDQHVAMHAPSGLAISPDGAWAMAFGGPVMDDPDNTTVCSLDGMEMSLSGYYDFWEEQASVASPGFSPDGSRVAAGNNSPYYPDANTMKLFSFSATGEPAELDSATVQNPSAAVFSDDGAYLMVSTFDGNTVEVFDVSDDTLDATYTASSMPLADRIIPIRRGPLAGHVLVGTYNAIVLMKVEANGHLTEVSRQNNGGEGATEIFGFFAVGHAY